MIFYLASPKEAVEIAQIHKREIKEGFLSSLPLVFLKKLYTCVIKNDFCVLAKEGNEVIGFIAGTMDVAKLYSFFLKRYLFYSVFILFPKVFNLLSLKKITETLFYPKYEKELPKAELLTIAVKKDFQGQGIAKKMFEVFILEMETRKTKVFKVLVGEKLKPAISFYEKSGFELLKETEIHKGQKSRIYIYKI